LSLPIFISAHDACAGIPLWVERRQFTFDLSASLLSLHSAQIARLPAFLGLVLLLQIRGFALVASSRRLLISGALDDFVAEDFQPVLRPPLIRLRLFGIIFCWPANAPWVGRELHDPLLGIDDPGSQLLGFPLEVSVRRDHVHMACDWSGVEMSQNRAVRPLLVGR